MPQQLCGKARNVRAHAGVGGEYSVGVRETPRGYVAGERPVLPSAYSASESACARAGCDPDLGASTTGV